MEFDTARPPPLDCEPEGSLDPLGKRCGRLCCLSFDYYAIRHILKGFIMNKDELELLTYIYDYMSHFFSLRKQMQTKVLGPEVIPVAHQIIDTEANIDFFLDDFLTMNGENADEHRNEGYDLVYELKGLWVEFLNAYYDSRNPEINFNAIVVVEAENRVLERLEELKILVGQTEGSR